MTVYRETIREYGSDSGSGRRTWSLPDLYDLPLSWSHLPDWDWPWPGDDLMLLVVQALVQGLALGVTHWNHEVPVAS